MKKFQLHIPTRFIFGKESINQLGSVCKGLNVKKAFLVYGSDRVVKSGLLRQVEDSLAAEGIEHMSMGGVVANPRLSTAYKMIEESRKFGPDIIIGVGGGSVLDTAKAVAHGTANPDKDVWDIFTGKVKFDKTLPVGSVLTIAATGSEMSNSAVLTNDLVDPPAKIGLNIDYNRAVFAVMNPELTMTLPKYQIGAGVADIFMHTAERYFCAIENIGNHLTDEFAEGLMRNIIKWGKIGYDDPSNYEAMSEIMVSGSWSHNGLTGMGAQGDTGREGDWACHQLGQAMSALYDATHGASLTAVFGTWARFVCHECMDRWVQYADKVFGIKGNDPEKVVEDAIKATEEWFKSIGMPTTITELLGKKLNDDECKVLTDICSRGRSRNIGSFKDIDYDGMLLLFKESR